MKYLVFLFLAVFFLSSIEHVRADTWLDPSWELMLGESELIAQIEVLEGGKSESKVKILKTYKGKAIQKEFWLSGFSSNYNQEPSDAFRKGERYIVFLRLYRPTVVEIKSWEAYKTQAVDKSDFIEDVVNQKTYVVWTPTAGEYPIRGDQVKYELLRTTLYDFYTNKPLKEFEEFLLQVDKIKPDAKYQKKLIKNIEVATVQKDSEKHRQAALYLLMLKLSNNAVYQSFLSDLVHSDEVDNQFALAQYLGKLSQSNRQSLDVLKKLVVAPYGVVQGESIRQLYVYHKEADWLGAFCLAHLSKTNWDGLYPASVMDPVQNEWHGGKIEIILTLGKLKYKPAEKQLLQLLDKPNGWLLDLVVGTLEQMESTAYIDQINALLESGNTEVIYDLCGLIADKKLYACQDALIKFIQNCDKDSEQALSFSISVYNGLGALDNEKTRKFLLEECQRILYKTAFKNQHDRKSWLEEFIQVFVALDMEEARPLVYEILMYWNGCHPDLFAHSWLLEQKKHREDSTQTILLQHLSTKDKLSEIQICAFLQNKTKAIQKLEKPRFEVFVKLDLPNFKSQDQTVEDLLSNSQQSFVYLDSLQLHLTRKTGIKEANLFLRKGSYITGIEYRLDHPFALLESAYSFFKKFPQKEDLELLLYFQNTQWVKEGSWEADRLEKV
ncbi:MAG: hypothetical protein MK212_19325, partial [Saprospiraceae bacterium]|nr:hypothetical protein [Saprospiraceae bacterium]